MKVIHKGPDDTRKVVMDWSRWLGNSGIASVEWEADTNGITLSDSSNTASTATIYVAGGVEDSEYWLRCTITTNDSPARIESRSVLVRVVRKLA